jgi:hypothetical protein
VSLSAREQQALDSIEEELAGSDARLVALLATFSGLASGEEMPELEKIPAGLWQATRCPRRRRRRPRPATVSRRERQLCQRLDSPYIALLLWLLLTVTLVAVALALSPVEGQNACTAPWPTVCAQPAHPHGAGSTDHTVNGLRLPRCPMNETYPPEIAVFAVARPPSGWRRIRVSGAPEFQAAQWPAKCPAQPA